MFLIFRFVYYETLASILKSQGTKVTAQLLLLKGSIGIAPIGGDIFLAPAGGPIPKGY